MSKQSCLWTAHLNQQFLPHQDGSKTPKSVASSGSQSPKAFRFGLVASPMEFSRKKEKVFKGES